MVISAQSLSEHKQFKDPNAMARWLLDLDLLCWPDLAFVEDLSAQPGFGNHCSHVHAHSSFSPITGQEQFSPEELDTLVKLGRRHHAQAVTALIRKRKKLDAAVSVHV